MTWNDNYLELFHRCCARFETGDVEFENYYTPADRVFLASIGCQPREFFDFVEDFCGEGTPSPSTAILITAVRRDYFMTMQNGQVSSTVITTADLPSFGETLGGISYLPRILAKGRAKLRGELDPDIMFGCGGDRNFLKNHGQLHPADFLRHLWAAGDDDAKMAHWIQENS